jgi:hypothetical protein
LGFAWPSREDVNSRHSAGAARVRRIFIDSPLVNTRAGELLDGHLMVSLGRVNEVPHEQHISVEAIGKAGH